MQINRPFLSKQVEQKIKLNADGICMKLSIYNLPWFKWQWFKKNGFAVGETEKYRWFATDNLCDWLSVRLKTSKSLKNVSQVKPGAQTCFVDCCQNNRTSCRCASPVKQPVEPTTTNKVIYIFLLRNRPLRSSMYSTAKAFYSLQIFMACTLLNSLTLFTLNPK